MRKSKEPTNLDRARRAQSALAKYAEEAYGAAASDEDPDTMIVDMLADIRHLCDRTNLDYGELDMRAHGHYCAEMHEQHKAKRGRKK